MNEYLYDLTDLIEVYRIFAMELLRTIQSPIYLCCDFNVDLLKINSKDHYNTFYNNLTAAGYLPRISLPTRITNHSATLIDNIY